MHGDKDTATAPLEATAAHIARDSLGDLRVAELLSRYLHAHDDAHSPAHQRDQATLHEVIDPEIGNILAAFLTEADVTAIARRDYRDSGAEQARLAGTSSLWESHRSDIGRWRWLRAPSAEPGFNRHCAWVRGAAS